MRPGELVLEERLEDRCHTLALSGELDLQTAPDLEAAVLGLCSDGASEVVLDLSGLEFVDSAGLRALIAVREVCDEHDCTFMLIHPRDQVERLFRLTGVLGRLPFLRRSAERHRDGGDGAQAQQR